MSWPYLKKSKPSSDTHVGSIIGYDAIKPDRSLQRPSIRFFLFERDIFKPYAGLVVIQQRFIKFCVIMAILSGEINSFPRVTV